MVGPVGVFILCYWVYFADYCVTPLIRKLGHQSITSRGSVLNEVSNICPVCLYCAKSLDPHVTGMRLATLNYCVHIYTKEAVSYVLYHLNTE